MTALDFISDITWDALPDATRKQAELCTLDLIGIAAGAHHFRLSRIVRDHATAMYGGTARMLFDSRTASPVGVALAAGMSIDALDGHDGYNPAKGHVGCPLFPAVLTLADREGASGRDFLTAMVLGYEFGSRAALAQHGTVPDYHTSGSWGAVTAAAAGALLMGLDRETTRHALGIAEYHGPRSQMMRCIDHPTMLKDGSGWGAMTGVAALDMAARGFTGAPAITVEEAPEYWADIGQRWLILEQYFKPYPVCRWAQAPAEGVLALRRAHDLSSDQVERIEVTTFHEAVRLATSEPKSTEEAQYSTSFPCAVAMVRGGVTPADIADDALHDTEVLRLSRSLVMTESDYANGTFPNDRHAKVALVLKDGQVLETDYLQPRWDHRWPPTEDELRTKYRDLTIPVLGEQRSRAIEEALANLPDTGLEPLTNLLFQGV